MPGDRVTFELPSRKQLTQIIEKALEYEPLLVEKAGRVENRASLAVFIATLIEFSVKISARNRHAQKTRRKTRGKT